MVSFAHRFRHVATGALLAAFVSLPVVAEDSEIYVSAGTNKDAQPNVLFVVDTSGSMTRQVGNTGLSRIETVRDVALELANSLRNVNLGLMRYNVDPDGGRVLQPVADIENPTHRAAIINTLSALSDSCEPGQPEEECALVAGFTPLSETYYEAALYYTGAKVDYGKDSVESSRVDGDQTSYKSPMSHQCQKNYIVYLTDGLPTSDVGANEPERIPRLVPTASCSTNENSDAAQGECSDELAAYLSDPEGDLSDSIEGNQNVLTYMIGFGPEVQPVPSFNLDTVARAGGTDRAYTATDRASLTTTLQSIFRELQTDRGTFVTPSISVDAFNRAQTSNDLFFSLFKASDRMHWSGNLKKYLLGDGEIVDANGNPAVTGGFFAETAKSIWSAAVDGADVEAGGAVSLVAAPDARTIYTTDPTDASTTLIPLVVGGTGAPFSDFTVGTGADAAACSDACKDAIRWARGEDVTTPAASDFVRKFGDPLHGQPAVVTYGDYDPEAGEEPDTYVFMPTNDGLLHAFDGRTEGTGSRELWAYIPKELLPRLGPLRANAPDASRTFGLDGDIRVLRLDKNNNGIIEYNADATISDRVWLFFGMRSGGNHYYALDVTQPTSPKLLWDIGPDQLPGVGLTWSPPVVTRVNVAGTDGNVDDEKFVLIFGGGYDYAQETQTYSTDATGNRIFMVDAKTGKLLWYAGATNEATPGEVPNLALDVAGRAMDNAIPGRITVIEHNGDGFADRMYAGDMGGRVWRFDILNNSEPDDLVRGGVFAILGNGGSGSPTAADNRRFYNAPDVALFQRRGEPSYYNVAIGSGYRGHPLNRDTVERFYSLRDPDPFAVYSQTIYDTRAVIQDGDAELPDVSSNPAGSTVTTTSKGWKYTLNRNGRGEKVLAEAITVGGTILFPTYEPVDPGVQNPCAPTSINRAYALTAFAGKPAINFRDDAGNEALTNADVFINLNQQGIVGAINVALLRPRDGEEGGEAPRTVCLAGVEILSRCVDIGGTVRTYWQRNDVP
jgi:type IV pilus assembly protein PilY1